MRLIVFIIVITWKYCMQPACTSINNKFFHQPYGKIISVAVNENFMIC